jgi:hypothetical protein
MNVAVIAATVSLAAHSGPPFPIVSSQIAGAYDIAIWADPDRPTTRKPPASSGWC